MGTSEQLDLLLNSIEEAGEPSRQDVGRFKIDVLSLIESKLPLIALECLTIAKQFTAGLVPESEVRGALERSWEYADQRWPGGGLGTSEAYAVRSGISLLHGLITVEDDFVESVSFFLALVNEVEPHHSQEAYLLTQHFGGVGDG